MYIFSNLGVAKIFSYHKNHKGKDSQIWLPANVNKINNK